MSKYKDAPRILRHRFSFFRGEVFEAGGKELMYRVVRSEPELAMLEEIENLFAPTKYTPKPGMFVDYITPEVCRQIHLIYIELGLNNAEGSARVPGQKAKHNPNASGGGEPKHKRVKRGVE